MSRHLKISFDLPEWVDRTRNACLRSVAEDVYYAKALAESYGAAEHEPSKQLMRAAAKSLRIFEDPKTDEKKRCAEGDRATRKYWEAKVSARDEGSRRRNGRHGGD